MGVRSLALAGIVAWAGLPLAAGPAAAGIEVLSQQRRVLVDIDVVEETYTSCAPFNNPGCLPDSTATSHYADSAEAPDSGPFVATANDPALPDTSASQDSEIGAWTIRASGDHASAATFTNSGPGLPVTVHGEDHYAESRASIEFQVDAARRYNVHGSVVTTGWLFAPTSARVRLTGPGGVLAEVQVDSDPACFELGCTTVGPVPFSASGVLLPGSYTLEALANGGPGGVPTLNSSFVVVGDGAFDVELALDPVPLPSLGGPGLALLALLVAAAGAAALRRRSGATMPRLWQVDSPLHELT
jgi:hypothetical protein